MALKRIIEKLDDVEEALRGFYKESNGKFVLDTDDDGRLNEFRENNRKLFTENEELKKKYDGIDPDEARKTKELAARMKKKELIDAGEFEKLIEAQLEPIKREFGTKIASLESINEKLTNEKKTLLVDNYISTIAPKFGVLNTAIRDVTRDAREKFSANEKGEIVALNPDGTVVRDAKGDPLTVESWLTAHPKEAPHRFAPSSGGGNSESRKPTEHGKIPAGDNQAFLNNLDGIAAGKVVVASH